MLVLLKTRYVALLFCLLCVQVSNARAEVAQVNNQQLAALLEKGVAVVDVRRSDEWALTGVVKGSHLMTFFDKNGRYDVGAWLAALEKVAPKGTPLVLICASGVRSNTIANLLDTRLGYTQVHNVKKGINQWIAKDKPVVKYQSKR